MQIESAGLENIVYSSSGIEGDALRSIVGGCNSAICALGHELEGRPMTEEEFLRGDNVDVELARLENLKSYQILDSSVEGDFERITSLASRVFSVPIALISLVDVGRQWFKSNHGLGDTCDTPRSQAFCAYTIQTDKDFFIVKDATRDDRFKDNPLVTGPPDIRMYAGAPLITPEGFKLGSFCIIDTKPRPEGLTIFEKQTLRELADMVMERLVMRKRDKERIITDKSKYMACTAHDLLTPLTGMQLSLSLARRSQSIPDIKDYINTSLHCAEMMGMIVNRSMALFNPQRKRKTNDDVADSEWKAMDLSAVFSKVEKVIKTYPKTVEVRVSLAPGILGKKVMIEGNGEISIYQSSLNYLTNACKATKKGSVELRVSVSDGLLNVECEDTGCGVPPESHSELFVPFSELNKSTLHGSGLGLFSVASHIHRLGGKYGYKSSPSQGSIFWFYVPCKPYTPPSTLVDPGAGRDLEAEAIAHSPITSLSSVASSDGTDSSSNRGKKARISSPGSSNMPPTAPAPTRRRRALIIDDSVTVRKPLARAISTKGFVVDTATNGLEGLERMKQRGYDLVLCDFLMPIMDGMECCSNLRTWEATNRPDLRQYVVGISANASIGESNLTEKPFSEYGFDDFFPKPVSLEKVVMMCESSQVKKAGVEVEAFEKSRRRLSEVGESAFGGYHFHESDGSFNILGSASDSMDSIDEGTKDPPGQLNDEAKPTVLIGEDSLSVVKMLRKICVNSGFKVTTVTSSAELLSRLKASTYYLLLVDNKLDDPPSSSMCSGTDAIKALKSWEAATGRVNRQKNIFSISGYSTQEDGGGSDDGGVYDGYLEKPIPFQMLENLLQTVKRGWTNRRLVDTGEMTTTKTT